MNLVFHQLKKDVRRTRVVLVLWLLLVVLQFGLAGWNVKPGDAVMQTFAETLFGLLTVFNYLVVLVLVPLIVHQEPLVGTTAFWFTRPLSRGTVLASKALFVLLLLALPILAQSIVFLANGVTLHDTLLAAPELLISQLCWILIIATLAVLTPNFARFAIVGAAVLIVWYLVLFILQMVLVMRNPQAYASTLASLTASRGLVSSLVLIAFGGSVVLLQYLSRRFTLAVTLAVASLGFSLLVQYVWPWDFLKPAIHVVDDPGFKADAIGAPVISSIRTNDQMALRGGTPLKEVQASLNFKNTPKGYIVQVGTIDSVLKSADGQKIPLQPANQQGVFSTSGNIDPDAIELGLGGVPVLNMDNVYWSSRPLVTLDAGTYGRYAATPLNYSAHFDCTAYKYVAVTELPLTKGARYDRGSEHLVITDVLNQPNGVDILLRQRNVHLLFAPRGQDGSAYMQDQSSVVYVLVNKARRQAVMQKSNNTFNFNMTNGILRNEPVRISFGPNDNNASNWLAPQLDQAWLADAVLVRLDLTAVATFTRTLTIAGFRLDGKFDLPGYRSPTPVADLDTLDQITLPHAATREQVQTYISDILVASRRENEGPHDPQLEMLEKVGTQNVDLLIQMAGDNHNYYLNRAINTLVQPDQKGMVIAALATNHDLIDTIVDHGWQADAKSTLLQAFAQNVPNAGYYPTSWITAIAALHDPSTYDSLKNYYINNPSREVFKALQSVPDFDLAGTVDLAWKKMRYGPVWRTREMLQPAAQFGEPDVVGIAVGLLKRTDDYSRQMARKILKQYTPATGATDADLIAWYESNKANLVFDPKADKFVLGSPGAQVAPAKTGP